MIQRVHPTMESTMISDRRGGNVYDDCILAALDGSRINQNAFEIMSKRQFPLCLRAKGGEQTSPNRVPTGYVYGLGSWVNKSANPLTEVGNGIALTAGGVWGVETSIWGFGVGSTFGFCFWGATFSCSSSSSGAIWKRVRFSNCLWRRGRPTRGVKAPGPVSVEKVGVAERVRR